MRWTVVVPVYNEEAFLPATLASLAAQTLPFRLVLVDNGSTDGCIPAARVQLSKAGVDATILSEPTPGQVHALKRGIDAARTELIAICDADTHYPPGYLEQATRLFDAGGPKTVAAAAILLPERGGPVATALARLHRRLALTLLPRQNHTSGAAQCFRTDDLKAAGGYDARIWPYVLKDHELMNRVLARGRQAHSPRFWCSSSDRRADRKGVRWTLAERIAYHLTPYTMQQRFFHERLGPRFAARGQKDTVLRDRGWASAVDQRA